MLNEPAWVKIRDAEKDTEEPESRIWDITDDLPKHPTKRWVTGNKATTWVVHHVGAGSVDTTPYTIARNTIRDKNQPGIPYHYYIMGNGTIYRTQPETAITYHCAGYNSYAVGVCLAGCFVGGARPTAEQLLSLEWLLDRHPEWKVFGHRDLASTECPGDWWEDWSKGDNGDGEDGNLEDVWDAIDELQVQVNLMEERLEAHLDQVERVKEAWK